jgi:hypothetical protein
MYTKSQMSLHGSKDIAACLFANIIKDIKVELLLTPRPDYKDLPFSEIKLSRLLSGWCNFSGAIFSGHPYPQYPDPGILDISFALAVFPLVSWAEHGSLQPTLIQL